MASGESLFLKIFGAIAASLITTMIIGMFIVLGSFDVVKRDVETNEKEIEKTLQFHKDDVKLIRTYMRDIRSDQKEIKTDIKEILKNSK